MRISIKWKIFIGSIALHALIVVAIALIPDHRAPTPIPVNIVNLPQEVLKQLPPLQRPVPVPPDRPAVPPAVPPPVPKQVVPEKRLPPSAVPKPKKFGGSDEVTLPKTGSSPRTGIPDGAERAGALDLVDVGPDAVDRGPCVPEIIADAVGLVGLDHVDQMMIYLFALLPGRFCRTDVHAAVNLH